MMREVTAVLPGLLDATVKGSALLLLVFIAVRALRGAAAATRHQVWAAGMVALLALPVLSTWVPWRLELLPRATYEAVTTLATAQANAEAAGSGDLGAALATDALMRSERATPAQTERAAPAILREGQAPVAEETTRATSGSASLGWSWGTLLAVLWLVGVVASLARLARGWVSAWRIVRRAVPVTDDAWAGDLLRVTERLRLGRPVRLLKTDRVRLVFTTGLFRPVVVLPSDSAGWPAERRRAVLLHELAHIRRGDLAMHLVSHVVCAVHWFNPLVWIAAARLRAESERASDDMVLALGTRASEYAEHLLDLVRSAGSLRAPATSLPLAQKSDFEGRLLAILAPDAPRSAPSRSATVGIVLAMGLSALPLAAISPATASSPARGSEAATPVAGPPSVNAAREAEQPGPSTEASDEDGVESTPSQRANPEPGRQLETRETAADPAAGSAGTEMVSPDAPVAHPQEAQRPAQAGPSAAVAALLTSLDDPSPEVRAEAVEALGSLQDTVAVAALSRALLTDESEDVRAMAAWSLGEIEHASGVPALMQAVGDDDSAEVRARATWALGQIEDVRAVPALTGALRDASADVREQAAWALGQIEDATAVNGLLSVLEDESAEVRQQAVWALGQIEDASAVAGLVSVLGDANAEVRGQAVWALGEIGDPTAVDGLSAALRDDHPEVRKQAAWALGEIGDVRALDDLVAAVGDRDAEVREQVLWALSEMEDPRARPAFEQALRDGEPEIRKQAVHGLASLDLATAPDALLAAAGDEDAEVREYVAWALGEIEDPASVPALTRLLQDPVPDVRRNALRGLAEIGDDSAIQAMINALSDDNAEVRREAARALGRSGGDSLFR